eukprot:scaffold554123_cov157-Attheya_sp.AAC.1
MLNNKKENAWVNTLLHAHQEDQEPHFRVTIIVVTHSMDMDMDMDPPSLLLVVLLSVGENK